MANAVRRRRRGRARRRPGHPRRRSRPRWSSTPRCPRSTRRSRRREADLDLAMGQRDPLLLRAQRPVADHPVERLARQHHGDPGRRRHRRQSPRRSAPRPSALGRDHRAGLQAEQHRLLARLADRVAATTPTRTSASPTLGDPINDTDVVDFILRSRSPTTPTPTATTRRREADMTRSRMWTLGTAAVVALVLAAGWFLLVAPTRADAAAVAGADRDPAGGQRPAGRSKIETLQGAGAGPAGAGGKAGGVSGSRSRRTRRCRPSSAR